MASLARGGQAKGSDSGTFVAARSAGPGVLQVELAQAAEDERRGVGELTRAGRAVVLVGDADVAHAVEHALERDARLRSRERRARAGVHPVSERDVLPRVGTVDDELIGVLE